MHTRVIATIVIVLIASNTLFGATPVAVWEFENDYTDSANSYDLTVRPGASVPFVNAPDGMGVNFSGGIVVHSPSSTPIDALDLPAASAPNPSSFNSGFSIMGCMRHTQSVQGTGPYSSGPIIQQQGWTLSELGWASSISYDGKLNLALRDLQDDRNNADSAVSVPEDGQWHHFAITWDGSLTGGISFYIDGSAVGSIPTLVGSFDGLQNASLPIVIGATPANAPDGATEHGYVGDLAELGIYSGVLTPAEIQAGYLECIPEPNALTILALAMAAMGARRGRRYV